MPLAERDGLADRAAEDVDAHGAPPRAHGDARARDRVASASLRDGRADAPPRIQLTDAARGRLHAAGSPARAGTDASREDARHQIRRTR